MEGRVRVVAVSRGSEKKVFGMGVRTSQMKVARSCHDAFLGSSARAAVDATSAIPATPAREYADVAVKTDGGWVDSSIVASQFSVLVCDHEKMGPRQLPASEKGCSKLRRLL